MNKMLLLTVRSLVQLLSGYSVSDRDLLSLGGQDRRTASSNPVGGNQLKEVRAPGAKLWHRQWPRHGEFSVQQSRPQGSCGWRQRYPPDFELVLKTAASTPNQQRT